MNRERRKTNVLKPEVKNLVMLSFYVIYYSEQCCGSALASTHIQTRIQHFQNIIFLHLFSFLPLISVHLDLILDPAN